MQVITAEHISKKYIIDHQKNKAKGERLGESITGRIKRLFGSDEEEELEKEEFWALRDVNFSINQGDSVGIVGHNGAGKSTLLKILSKITEPTEGRISIKGRVASLLEVGTGFHPELTGRENIFLNGAILGMTRDEIKKSFDEIVDFSGVERFLDTPVKRYSSGMYVRLGFAIAANLNPEILIIDEVLAVGDADFQKKCLGKMRDVTGNGRTILFVSHNLTAVQALCNKAYYFEKGKLILQGETNQVVTSYLSHVGTRNLEKHWDDLDTAPGDERARFKSVRIEPEYYNDQAFIDVRTPMNVHVDFWNLEDDAVLNISLHLYALTGECIFNVGTQAQEFSKGLISATLEIPGMFLNDGSYMISVMLVKDTSIVVHNLEEVLNFEVEDHREGTSWYGKWPGYVRPKFNFNISQAEVLI